MTVQAEELSVPAADRAAAERYLEDAYRQWWKPLTYFIYSRVDDRHRMHVEDVAADVFMTLWTDLSAGKEFRAPWGLLCYLARQRISNIYKAAATEHEASVDFCDPGNGALAAGSTYAAEQPEAASLLEELNEAMEVMAQASKAWRDMHKESYALRLRADGSDRDGIGGYTPETQQRLTEQFQQAAETERGLLADFRAACQRVGQLRADVEQVAGPRWNASSGGPTAAKPGNKRAGSVTSDLSITHCPDGHLMDLDNTNFSEAGDRTCRACKAENAREWWAKKNAGSPTKGRPATTPAESVAEARRLLSAPETADLSIREVARRTGMSHATLLRRVPDHRELRQAARSLLGASR